MVGGLSSLLLSTFPWEGGRAAGSPGLRTAEALSPDLGPKILED